MGWGEEGCERGREGGGEMFCHHGKHPSYEQQRQISDSPQASAALADRRLKQHFGLETTESINSACKRITLLERREPALSSYIPPLICTVFIPSSFLFLFLQCIFHACFYVIECYVRHHHVLCVYSPAAGFVSRARVGLRMVGTHVVFLVRFIYNAKPDSALYCDLLS